MAAIPPLNYIEKGSAMNVTPTRSASVVLTLGLLLNLTAHAATNEMAAATETAVPQTEASDVDYGEMYVVQKKEITKHRWEAAIGYSYGFSNPYRGMHGVNISLDRRIGEYFAVGLAPVFYMNTQKDVARIISAELSAQRVDTLVYEPKYGTYLVAKFSPLSGLLNLLNRNVVGFEMVLDAGAGVMWYKQSTGTNPSLRAGISPHIMFNDKVGLSFGFTSYFDRLRDGSWQNRLETGVNLIAGF